jgi:hypothetical protein
MVQIVYPIQIKFIFLKFSIQINRHTRSLNVTKFFDSCGFSVVKIRVNSSSGSTDPRDNRIFVR